MPRIARGFPATRPVARPVARRVARPIARPISMGRFNAPWCKTLFNQNKT